MGDYQTITHTFPPVYDRNSNILILGTFPSVKSRENGFYYGNPQNRFWGVLTALYGVKYPETIEEKKKMLYQTKIAIWDVIASCDIIGSSDTSIKNVIPNDLTMLLQTSSIKAIYTNGKAAGRLFVKYSQEKTGIRAQELPSTSPANAAYRLEQLIAAWSIIKEGNDS